MGRTAVVTGASSGIGAATATRLAAEGFDVVVGARRLDRLRAVAGPIGATALELDVTDDGSVARFCDAVDECAVLVNNAGGAFGLDRIEQASIEDWQRMYDTNVLGTVRVTKALLGSLRASGDGHVVVIGSIAAMDPYPGGAGYNAAKFGERAFAQVLRQELLGEPIRVTEIDPGMVATEFSTVRFGGDETRAAKVYAGMTPLTADDVADAVAWSVTRPSHVNVDQLVLMARDQYGAQTVHRRT
jgi:NADP-dependent 3-hydroxy acid dehydrogenase YdfG